MYQCELKLEEGGDGEIRSGCPVTPLAPIYNRRGKIDK
jgi:hypothetical protein